MPSAEKQSIMDSFAEGHLQVLVSTTVIEVGIDVPNATVMTIFAYTSVGLSINELLSISELLTYCL